MTDEDSATPYVDEALRAESRFSIRQPVAILTLPGFNEIDTFVATRMIDSVPELRVELVGPGATATSMAGVTVETPGDWDSMRECVAAIIGSGSQTFEHIENRRMMSAIETAIDEVPIVGSQCSGAAILHRVGRLHERTACTDLVTAPRLRALGIQVLNEPFHAINGVATAGGCLASTYLGYWMIEQLVDRDRAGRALARIAPVGELSDYQDRIDRLIPQS